MPESPTINIRMPKKVLAELAQVAKKEQRTRSQMAVLLIQEGLASYAANPNKTAWTPRPNRGGER